MREMVESDYPFLRRLFESVRGLQFISLMPEARKSVLDMQLKAQQESYRSQFPNAEFLILESRGDSIGYFIVDNSESITLVDIALMPQHRMNGIGTAFMNRLVEVADRESKEVILHVDHFSPARRLYSRFGFLDSASNSFVSEMRRLPNRRPPANSDFLDS